MAYWYVMQNTDVAAALDEGALWTCPEPGGAPGPRRYLISEPAPGDTVFHHRDACLQAVSEVTDKCVDWPRGPAPAYPRRKEGEGDAGWLVRVKPLQTDIELRYEDVARLIELGPPGPYASNGHAHNKFISSLPDSDGVRLLEHLGMEYVYGGLGDSPALAPWDDGETDSLAESRIRNEQDSLRRRLIRGRTVAPCSLCQAEFPAQRGVLIAAHIKPRKFCSDEERRDYRAVMLVCNLGCDALFEWGYVVVGEDGRIEPGLSGETEAMRSAVEALAGRRCTAYDDETAPRFEFHRQFWIDEGQ